MTPGRSVMSPGPARGRRDRRPATSEVRRRGWPARRAAVLLGVALAVGGCDAAPSATQDAAGHDRLVVTTPTRWDWPTYGYDAQHTFTAPSTLTPASVPTLGRAWFFPTGDAVTATPTVVDDTVYVGSWDDNFYAIDLQTGRLRWVYHLSHQDAVTPYPGENPRNDTSDGGLVTSSAWFQPGNGTTRPDLVIFGAGYTLYALDAHTGALFWRHDYTGRPWEPPDPNTDGTRIFSSPVVWDGKVLFAADVDGQSDSRGYVVAASLATGRQVWEYQTDVAPDGRLLRDGCGDVWSSGSILPAQDAVVFDEADCNFSNPPPTAETVFALRVSDGTLLWRYRPSRADNQCDWDFGATVNVGLGAHGQATFLGVGSKDGTYYSLDPETGALRWKTNVVFGGFSGGFIATAAYDGNEVVGSTALGDFGRFESNGNQVCDPGNPRDTSSQEPSVHAFDAHTGAVLWQQGGGQSFGATTITNGMSFNGVALTDVVEARSVADGALLDSISLPAPCWSGIATVGNAVVFGTGASQQGSPDGVYAYTPGGAVPAVPGG